MNSMHDCVENERCMKLWDCFQSHSEECRILTKKLGDPNVPIGKKKKYVYRIGVIQKKVLPRLRRALEPFALSVG